jgi:hypothetical protein
MNGRCPFIEVRMNPIAIILQVNSIMKTTVQAISRYLKTIVYVDSGSLTGLLKIKKAWSAQMKKQIR